MKIYRKGSFWFTVLVLITLLVVVSVSSSYSEKARLVPLIIGIPALILTILVLIGERYPGLIRGFDVSLTDLAPGGVEAESRSEKVGERSQVQTALLIFVCLAGSFTLIYLVGFLIAVPVFIFLFLKIYGRIGWLNTLVVVVVASGVIYGAFEVFMKADLFKGILFGAILPPI